MGWLAGYAYPRTIMKFAWSLIAAAVLALVIRRQAQSGRSVLFIGNSFTFAAGSPVRFYRSDTVTDLNNGGLAVSRRCSSRSVSRPA